MTAGVQFDRTATIFLGGVNLFFGTTQNRPPRSRQAGMVERDLTDYSALFRKAVKARLISAISSTALIPA